MSTIAPETVRAVEPSVRARGATLLDAPVSGSVPVVERGELLIMAGGDAEALDRARPVLEAMSSKIIHVGELGTGATMKLAVNALVHGLNAALSESLVLAERAGVDRTAAYEVFASGAAAAPYVLYKRAAFERPDETPVAFRLDLVGKDLDLILELARAVGAPMPQAETNRDVVRAALATGLADSRHQLPGRVPAGRRADPLTRRHTGSRRSGAADGWNSGTTGCQPARRTSTSDGGVMRVIPLRAGRARRST